MKQEQERSNNKTRMKQDTNKNTNRHVNKNANRHINKNANYKTKHDPKTNSK